MDLIAALGERFAGPMSFRLVLQPVMASILAVIAGRRDVRDGMPPFLWTLLKRGRHRKEMLREVWKDVGRVCLLAIVMEVAYQLIVRGSVSVMETIAISVLLAVVPYIVLRGLVNRLLRK